MLLCKHFDTISEIKLNILTILIIYWSFTKSSSLNLWMNCIQWSTGFFFLKYLTLSASFCSSPGESGSFVGSIWARSGPHAAKKDACQSIRTKQSVIRNDRINTEDSIKSYLALVRKDWKEVLSYGAVMENLKKNIHHNTSWYCY